MAQASTLTALSICRPEEAREIVVKMLVCTGGNVRHAAIKLRVPRTSLLRTIERLGLRPMLNERWPLRRVPIVPNGAGNDDSSES